MKEEISLASYIKGPVFVAGSSPYQVSMESLLIGHEDWVYSVEWQPPSFISESECHQPQCVLCTSMDKTMMIWKPEKTTGIWINVVTVGELRHCALGFYGGHWSPNGDSILVHGYGGSFHLWKDVGVASDDWKPQKVPSGHFAAVSDIVWSRNGEYILYDRNSSYKLLIWQTTRVFAPWSKRSSENEESWHKIARPQVHGHDINCVTIIQGKGNHRFVTGAEEKVSRVFEAPLSFLKTLNHATSGESSLLDDLQADVQILGANMSALGPSPKPIYTQGSISISGGNLALASWFLEVCLLITFSQFNCDTEFSYDDNFLLAVSRDHQFSVFSIKDAGADEIIYELVTRQEAHKRIIWACSWNPFGVEFATGSRDKTVKIWAVENGTTVKQLMTLPSFKSSVTALS